MTDIAERIAARILVDDNGCWIWQGGLTKNGYGTIGFDRKKFYVHRASYTAHVGEIPAGLDLDHLCRVRSCCNPEHLEPVTRSENLRRSPLVGRTGSSPTHCKRGHEFTPENTRPVWYVRVDGSRGATRACIACRRLAEERYSA